MRLKHNFQDEYLYHSRYENTVNAFYNQPPQEWLMLGIP